MKTIITTVGTSLITNYLDKSGDIDEYRQYKDYLWNKSLSDTNDLPIGLLGSWYEKIGNSIESYKNSENVFKLSAEMTSFDKLKLNSEDKVVLFCSETVDGKFCADVLEKMIKELWFVQVEIVVVSGLQATDAEKFQREGLVNLLRKLILQLNNDKYSNPVLNITGGYKGVIPYVTILGMIEKVPIKYIFEDSNQIISIPILPLTYEVDYLEDLSRLIGKKNNVKKISDLKIPKDDLEEMYGGLIEIDNDDITYSIIGEMLFDKYLNYASTIVKLSNVAFEQYKTSTIKKRIVADLDWLRKYEREKAIPNAKYGPKHSELLDRAFVAKKTGDSTRIIWKEIIEGEKHILQVLEIFDGHNKHYDKKYESDLRIDKYNLFHEFSDF